MTDFGPFRDSFEAAILARLKNRDIAVSCPAMTAIASFAPDVHFNISPRFFVYLWAGLACMMALGIYSAIRNRSRRREGLNQFALESGFAFFETPDVSLQNELAEINIYFGQMVGAASYRNILKGAFRFGDFIIADRTDRERSSTSGTIAAFKFATSFPTFFLCPESGIFKVIEKLGVREIDFDAAPEFSRRFFLHGEDEEAVRALFKPQVTAAFEGFDKFKWCVAASGRWLTVYQPTRLVPLEQLRVFREQAEKVADAFRQGKAHAAGF